jgi:hypothetical protein
MPVCLQLVSAVGRCDGASLGDGLLAERWLHCLADCAAACLGCPASIGDETLRPKLPAGDKHGGSMSCSAPALLELWLAALGSYLQLAIYQGGPAGWVTLCLRHTHHRKKSFSK